VHIDEESRRNKPEQGAAVLIGPKLPLEQLNIPRAFMTEEPGALFRCDPAISPNR